MAHPGHRLLIENREHLVRLAIAQLVVHEVDRPDVVGMSRPQADDPAIRICAAAVSLVYVFYVEPGGVQANKYQVLEESAGVAPDHFYRMIATNHPGTAAGH